MRIGWGIFINYWISAHPPPPPPPNVAFGKIEYPKFPKESKDLKLTYKLETISGGFPESSPSGKVYFMPILAANLLSLDRASEKAVTMGFQGEPLALSESEYLWSDPQNPLRALTINIVTGNLILSYDYRQDQAILNEKNLPVNEQAIEEARDILNNYYLAKEDIMYIPPQITYLKLQGGMLVKIGGLIDADFIKIGFLRAPLDDLQILTPNDDQYVISIILSGSQDTIKRVIELKYNYQIIDRENFATYPLKIPSQAFEELKTGHGYIANPGTDENKEKIIRDIYLGYYDSLMLQTYLEPVWVFSGDKDFKAYVPALINDWYNESYK